MTVNRWLWRLLVVAMAVSCLVFSANSAHIIVSVFLDRPTGLNYWLVFGNGALAIVLAWLVWKVEPEPMPPTLPPAR